MYMIFKNDIFKHAIKRNRNISWVASLFKNDLKMKYCFKQLALFVLPLFAEHFL